MFGCEDVIDSKLLISGLKSLGGFFTPIIDGVNLYATITLDTFFEKSQKG